MEPVRDCPARRSGSQGLYRNLQPDVRVPALPGQSLLPCPVRKAAAAQAAKGRHAAPGNSNGGRRQAGTTAVTATNTVAHRQRKWRHQEHAPQPVKMRRLRLRRKAAGTNPIFRTTARLVQVDVVATDKQGRPIPGLKESDFTVLQDGKPQKVRVFEPHAGNVVAENSTPSAPETKLPPETDSNHPKRGHSRQLDHCALRRAEHAHAEPGLCTQATARITAHSAKRAPGCVICFDEPPDNDPRLYRRAGEVVAGGRKTTSFGHPTF